MKKLAKLKLHDVRVLRNSEMRNITGSHDPDEFTGYGDCMDKCIRSTYSGNGWYSVFRYGASAISPIPVGLTVFGMCLIACEEYGPHIHY